MEKVQDHTYVVILAGGGGTRLWPMSRNETPKQFSRIFGGKSLFEMAWERAKQIVPPKRIFISTSAKYVSYILKETKGVLVDNIIGEPMRRDTALAHGVANTYIAARDSEAVVISLASDHLITPVSAFVKTMKKAADYAWETDLLVNVGIKPRYPHTGMGHILARKPIADGVLQGEKYVEKPELRLAKVYTESGIYFWNSNLCAWKAKVFLKLLRKHARNLYTWLPRLKKSIGTSKEQATLQLAFQMSPTMAVEYAVTEKLKKFICIPGKFHWTDVGDWSEVKDNLEDDGLGNVIIGNSGRGEYIGVNSKNNLLVLDKQLVATVGISDLLVVDTSDSILICNVKDDQAVKKVVEILKEMKLTKYL